MNSVFLRTLLIGFFVGSTAWAAEPEAASLRDDKPAITEAYANLISEQSNLVSLGYSLGTIGDGFITGARLDYPISKLFSIRVISNFNHGPFFGDYDPIWTNGVQIMLKGPVIFGIFRLYGGGGPWFGWRPNATAVGKSTGISGGGYSGIEFFSSPIRAFFIEVGGQGTVHKGGIWRDGGSQVKTGSMFYF